MDINRSFNHRTFGAIGSVVFTVPKGKFTLDGQELPESSVAHLMTFALQSLQDAYAGAKTAAEAVGAFEQKRDKLIAGTLGTRSSGGGVSEETAVTRMIVRSAMKARWAADKNAADAAAFKAMTADEQNAKIDAVAEANAAVFADAIAARLEARAKERAEKGALVATFTI
jgi:hypothetical protein